ncbi:MAG: hypothetical protein ACPG8W_16880 [Candidatus Promineifilaceae bacterium]
MKNIKGGRSGVWFLVCWLFVVGLLGCGAAVSTSETPTQVVATPVVIALEPTPTLTLLPTVVVPTGVRPTITIQPSLVPSPTAVATETMLPTATPIVITTQVQIPLMLTHTVPNVMQWKERYIVQTFPHSMSDSAEWSSINNDIAFATCRSEQANSQAFYLASSPDFSPAPLNVPERSCDAISPDFSWRPDGSTLYLEGTSEYFFRNGYFDSDTQTIWIIDRNGEAPVPTSETGRWVGIAGWINTTTAVSSWYGGGGHSGIGFLNLEGPDVAGSATLRLSQLQVAENRVMGAHQVNSWRDGMEQVVWVLRSIPNPRPLFGFHEDFAYLQHLGTVPDTSRADASQLEFYSTLLDYSAATGELLVLTWEPSSVLQPGVPATFPLDNHLQLWEPESDVLEAIATHSYDGAISPDGRWIVTHSAENYPALTVQIIDRQTHEVVQSYPSFRELDEFELWPVRHHAQFSADSRYVTFYTAHPDPNLMQFNVLELETMELVHSDSVTQPVAYWSPTTNHLLYLAVNEWQWLDAEKGERIALSSSVPESTQQNTVRVAFSADGTYLMFVSQLEDVLYILRPILE